MTAVEPSACRWCGIPKREHFRRWHAEAKWHKHTEPTQEQILARMHARRANPTADTPLDPAQALRMIRATAASSS